MSVLVGEGDGAEEPRKSFLDCGDKILPSSGRSADEVGDGLVVIDVWNASDLCGQPL